MKQLDTVHPLKSHIFSMATAIENVITRLYEFYFKTYRKLLNYTNDFKT